jgi:hypothetical protein
VGTLDNHQCNQRGYVVHLRGKRGGTCCSNGDHVGVLSSELSERFQGMAKAQPGVKFLFSDFFYLICKVLAQIRVLEKSKY